MDQVNWIQLGWGILFGLGVGLLVYMIGTAMDKVRERRWERELNADVRDIAVPGQHDGTDGA